MKALKLLIVVLLLSIVFISCDLRGPTDPANPIRHPNITIIFPNDNTGINIGAGCWKIEIAAIITDEDGNPASEGTPVAFRIANLRKSENNTIIHAMNNPLFINPAALVGNANLEGIATEGTAYTYMLYHGTNSNWWVDIQVDIIDYDQVTAFKLPMQYPSITMTTNPEFIQWESGDTSLYKFSTIIVSAIDGQGCPLFNVPIDFSATTGISTGDNTTDSFRDHDTISTVMDTQWEVPTEYQCTDPEGDLGANFTVITPFSAPTDENGIQKKRYYYSRNLFDPNDFTNPITTSVDVNAVISGVDNTAKVANIQVKKWRY